MEQFEIIPAEFYFDKIGVIIKIELNDEHVFRGELVYDGRNQIIFNRNNKKFFLLSQIAPIIRKRILKSEHVTIAEHFNDEIVQAYDICVRLTDEIPGEDNYMAEMQKYIEKLKAEMGDEKFNELKKQAIHSFEKLTQ